MMNAYYISLLIGAIMIIVAYLCGKFDYLHLTRKRRFIFGGTLLSGLYLIFEHAVSYSESFFSLEGFPFGHEWYGLALILFSLIFLAITKPKRSDKNGRSI
jgi:hypothetical protein